MTQHYVQQRCRKSVPFQPFKNKTLLEFLEDVAGVGSGLETLKETVPES